MIQIYANLAVFDLKLSDLQTEPNFYNLSHMAELLKNYKTVLI